MTDAPTTEASDERQTPPARECGRQTQKEVAGRVALYRQGSRPAFAVWGRHHVQHLATRRTEQRQGPDPTWKAGLHGFGTLTRKGPWCIRERQKEGRGSPARTMPRSQVCAPEEDKKARDSVHHGSFTSRTTARKKKMPAMPMMAIPTMAPAAKSIQCVSKHITATATRRRRRAR